jgi:hypothetical protein
MLVRVLSASQTSGTLSNYGTVNSVGVRIYWDAGLTSKVTAIDWGTIDPGSQKSFTIYIYNEGNNGVTLTETTSNWNPTFASNFMSLSWDYNNKKIDAGAYVGVTLTLKADAATKGISNFSFDITILASE